MNNEFLKSWEYATKNLAEYFSARYFGNGAEMYWVADDIAGVLFINDYFFNLSDMVDFIRYDYSKEKMFEYYEYSLECSDKKENPVCIRDYKKLKNHNL